MSVLHGQSKDHPIQHEHDDDEDRSYPTHEIISHMRKFVWNDVKRMGLTMGEDGVGVLLFSRRGQHFTVAEFIQNRFDALRIILLCFTAKVFQQPELLWVHVGQQIELSEIEAGPGFCLRSKAHASIQNLEDRLRQERGSRDKIPAKMVCRVGWRHKDLSYRREERQVALFQSNLSGCVKPWALGLNLDPYVFKSLKVFKTRLDKFWAASIWV